MTERFIVDDAGTLIDMVTRNTYDYVSEVCPLLNDIDSENTHVKYLLSEHMVDLNNCKGKCSALEEENEQLKLEIQQIKKDTDRIAIKLHKDCDEVYYENQKLKQQIQQDIDDIRLCQSFIMDKGYSLQDLKEWEDMKKECYGNG